MPGPPFCRVFRLNPHIREHRADSVYDSDQLRMRCLEGRDVADVAAELGMTSEQVWYRLHRLMKKLRARAAVFSGEHFSTESIEPPAAEDASRAP